MSAKGPVRERIRQLLEQKLLTLILPLLPTEGPSKGKQGARGKTHLHSTALLLNGP